MTNESIIGIIKRHSIAIVVILVALVAAWFVTGNLLDRYNGSKWAARNAELEQQLKEQKVETAAKDKLAAKYAAENDLLRETAERQAAILRESEDREAKAEGQRVQEIQKNFEKKLEEIAATPDDEQRKKTCKEAAEIGITFTFCEELGK